MNYDSDDQTDKGALIRNLTLIGLVLVGITGYSVWKWTQPKGEPGVAGGAPTATMPGRRPAGSGPKSTSSWPKLVIGDKAVTADEARQPVRAWAEKAYQADGLTPEPPHLPKERWTPFARAMVWAECDAPEQLARREIHSMARDLAPVAGEHPVSAFTVGMVLMGEPGSAELLEKAVKGLEAVPGSETLTFHAAAGLALATTDQEGEEVVKKRVEAAIAALRRALDAEAGFSKQHDRVAAHVLMGGHAGSFFESMHERVAEEVGRTEAAKPWLKKWIEGQHCLQKGWDARGGGYANTVSGDGFSVFHHESEKARRLLEEAWNLKPETPEPAVTQIYCALSMKEAACKAHMKRWFAEVLRLQVDVPAAAQHYLWALRPRWHGSHEQMQEFGLACADTARHDSALPWVLLQAHRDCASEWDVPDEYFKEIHSHCYNRIHAVFEGAEAEPKRAAWRAVDRTHAAVFHFKCGRYDEAAKWLQKLDFKPNARVIDEWGDVDTELLTGKTSAYADTAIGAQLQKAERAEKSFDASGAAEIYEDVLDEDIEKLKGAGREYVENRLAIARIERDTRGSAVSLLPDAKFRGWSRQGGGWEQEGGAWLHLGRESFHTTCCEARIGPGFTLEGEVEVIDPGEATQVWFSYGYPERPEKDRWVALRFLFEKNGAHVLLSRGMGQPLESPKVDLTPKFRFKLESSLSGMTLHVNDKTAFENIPVPPGYVKEQYSQIGIGAFTQSERTRVRIRQLTVRR
ncbi:MAG: hypothetical protein JNG86_22200 [Verrucomicrobiaceae bacterium]|nr:hypothetical protein [Verrucomicrobiaceae bacterium]